VAVGKHKLTKRQTLRRRLIEVEVLGWFGATCLVAAYLMLSFDILSADSLLYQSLNVVAAAGLIVNGLTHKAIPSVTTNVFWCLIGIIAIIRILL
jgi:hypothetical protein